MKKILKNNKGAGIVTVVITIAFLTVLGSMMLMLSYTTYSVTVAKKFGDSNEYAAESVLNEALAGVQTVVSKAMGEAYTAIMKNYSLTGLDTPSKFRTQYRARLLGDELFQKQNNQYYYKPDVIKGYLKNDYGNCVSFSSTDSVVEFVTEEIDDVEVEKEIKLKNLKMTYTKNGRTASLTTDITIKYPDISCLIFEISDSNLTDYSVVANGTVNAGNCTVSGNMYAGGRTNTNLELVPSVSVSDSKRMTYSSGTMICGSSIKLQQHGEFTADPVATIWTRGIDINTAATGSFMGTTYVANDLVLSGVQSKAILEGTYFGFGYWDGVSENNGKNSSDYSSSIISNAANTTNASHYRPVLDMTGLEELTLSGYSFIGSGASAVRMGESISTKANQIIYLIPAELLQHSDGTSVPTNPDIVNKTQKKEVTLNTSKTVFTINRYNKTASDYDASVKTVEVDLGTGQAVLYYFFDFGTREDANQFFRDYFTAYPEKVEEYINTYISVPDSAEVQKTAGNSFTNADGVSILLPSDTVDSDVISRAQVIEADYNNYCKNLKLADIPNSSDNVYDNIVDKVNLDKLSSTIKTGGVVVTKQNEYVCEDENVHLIIAKGNVTVKTNYIGLIICGGNLDIKDGCSVTSAPSAVNSAYNDLKEYLESNSIEDKYLRFELWANNSEDNSNDATPWSISDLVSMSSPVKS